MLVDYLFDGKCPYCGHVIVGHLAVTSSDAPEPGDICLCDRCGGASTYDSDLKMVPLTSEQADALMNSPNYKTVMSLWLKATDPKGKDSPQ